MFSCCIKLHLKRWTPRAAGTVRSPRRLINFLLEQPVHDGKKQQTFLLAEDIDQPDLQPLHRFAPGQAASIDEVIIDAAVRSFRTVAVSFLRHFPILDLEQTGLFEKLVSFSGDNCLVPHQPIEYPR